MAGVLTYDDLVAIDEFEASPESALRKQLKNDEINVATHNAEVKAAEEAAVTEAEAKAGIAKTGDFAAGGPFPVYEQEINTTYTGSEGALRDSPEIKAIEAKLGIIPTPAGPGIEVAVQPPGSHALTTEPAFTPTAADDPGRTTDPAANG